MMTSKQKKELDSLATAISAGDMERVSNKALWLLREVIHRGEYRPNGGGCDKYYAEVHEAAGWIHLHEGTKDMCVGFVLGIHQGFSFLDKDLGPLRVCIGDMVVWPEEDWGESRGNEGDNKETPE